MRKKRVTILDIADAVGMSKATVSAVLGNKSHCYASEKTKARIRQVAKEMGYRPNLLARGLKNGRSRVIGFINDSIHHEVSAKEIVALTNALLPLGYQVQVMYSRGDELLRREACNRLADSGCDALIVSGNFDSFNLRSTVPIFIINGDPRGTVPGRTVLVDYDKGITESLRYLNEMGHRNVCLAAAFWTAFVSDQRKLAFDAFCRNNQVNDPAKRTLIFSNYRDINPENLRQFLFQQPDCTAFVCTNDFVAMKLIQVITDMGGRVPDDFSVIGFDDNVATDYFVPPLSSVHQPTELLVNEIVKLLMNELEKSDHEVQTVVPCHLVKRKSIDKARQYQLNWL